MGLQHVKNPIKLAREMLLRREKDLEGGEWGASQGRCSHPLLAMPGAGDKVDRQLHQFSARPRRNGSLDIVDKKYFFVQAALGRTYCRPGEEKNGFGVATWDQEAFRLQGTCGAVALDSEAVVELATSTGVMTNKREYWGVNISYL